MPEMERLAEGVTFDRRPKMVRKRAPIFSQVRAKFGRAVRAAAANSRVLFDLLFRFWPGGPKFDPRSGRSAD